MFGFGTSHSDTIVNPQKFTDWVFLIGWVSTLGGFFALGFLSLLGFGGSSSSGGSGAMSIFLQPSLYINIALALCAGFGMVVGFLQLLKSHAELIVKGAVYGGWFILITLSMMFYGMGSGLYNSGGDVDKAIGLTAVACAGITAMMSFYAIFTALLACCCYRHSLRVTAALLQCAAEVFSDKLVSALSLSMFSTLTGMFFLYLWMGASYGWCQMFGYDPNDGKSPPLAALAISMFVYFWTSNVLNNTVHVAYCKMVGCWYYMTETEYAEKCKPITFYIHAWTYHIGSICFGSLVMAVISTIRWVAQYLENDNHGSSDESPAHRVFRMVKAVLLRIVTFILTMVEEVADFLTKIAYVKVAVQNEPFVDSAKTTYKLFCNTEGLKLVMQTSLTNVVLRHVTAFFLFSILFVCWVIMKMSMLGGDVDSQAVLFGFGLTAVAASCVVSDSMGMLESGVLAIFVLYAEDSSKLRSVSHYLWGELECRRTICAKGGSTGVFGTTYG